MNSEFGILCSVERGRTAVCFVDQECQNPSKNGATFVDIISRCKMSSKFRVYDCPK
jgi:hypothetical protein